MPIGCGDGKEAGDGWQKSKGHRGHLGERRRRQIDPDRLPRDRRRLVPASRVLLVELDAGLRGMDIMLGLSGCRLRPWGPLEGRCNINSAIIPSPNVPELYAIVAPVSLKGPILMQTSGF